MRRVLLASLLAACHSSSNPAKPDGPIGGRPDGSVPIADGGGTKLADAPLPTADAGPQATETPVTLPDEPAAMAQDHATNRLYVTLGSPLTGGTGIAVLDTTSDTLLTTIANPQTPGGQSELLDTIVVDETADKVYVASSLDRYLWAIDGSNNTVTGPLDTNPGNPGAITSVIGLAVDPIKQQLCSSLLHSVGDSEIIVVDTATFALSSTTDITGLSNSHSIAYDPVNHLLFACGTTAAHEMFADAFDTNAGALTGTPLDLGPDRGDLESCVGGPGNAFAPIGGSAASVWALEPTEVQLNFDPTIVVVDPTPQPDGSIVTIFMAPNGSSEFIVQLVTWLPGEPSAASKSPFEYFPVTGWNPPFTVDTLGFLVLNGYLVKDIPKDDAGAQTRHLAHVSIPLPQ